MAPVCYLLAGVDKPVVVSVHVLPRPCILPLGGWDVCRWSWTDDLHVKPRWCPDRDANLRWRKKTKENKKSTKDSEWRAVEVMWLKNMIKGRSLFFFCPAWHTLVHSPLSIIDGRAVQHEWRAKLRCRGGVCNIYDFYSQILVKQNECKGTVDSEKTMLFFFCLPFHLKTFFFFFKCKCFDHVILCNYICCFTQLYSWFQKADDCKSVTRFFFFYYLFSFYLFQSIIRCLYVWCYSF